MDQLPTSTGAGSLPSTVFWDGVTKDYLQFPEERATKWLLFGKTSILPPLFTRN